MKTEIGNITPEVKIADGPFGRTAIEIVDGVEVVAADLLDQTAVFAWIRPGGQAFKGGMASRADWDIGKKKWAPLAGVQGFACSRDYVPTIGRNVIASRAGTKEVDLAEKGKKHQQGQIITTINPDGTTASRFFNPTTGLGRVAYDPATVKTFVMSKDCAWYEVGQTGGILSRGKWDGMKTGEKFDFMIVPRPDGRPSVWHCALNGYSAQSSRYQNGLRVNGKLPPITWADYKAYPKQGDDMNHMGIGQVPNKPRKAIIGGVFDDLFQVNVWGGRKMQFPTNRLFQVGPATQEMRHGPHFATTRGINNEERTWAVWNDKGRIMMVDIMAAIQKKQRPVDVAQGSFPSIHAIGSGDVALAYVRNNAIWGRTVLVD